MFDNPKLQRPGILSKVAMFFVLVFTIVPLIYVVFFSFKSNNEIMLDPMALPETWNLNNYENVIKTIPFLTMFKNTFTIIAIAWPIELFIAVFAAFAISRFKVVSHRFRNFMNTYFITGLIVPGCVMLFPIYKIMVELDLWNTLWAVILPFIGWSAPLSISVLVESFDNIPPSLEEAGILDGCTVWQLLFKIMVPLNKSALSTVGILHFLGMWNDFLLSKVMLNGVEVRTISLASMYFKNQYSHDYGMMAAGVVMLVIPQLVMFLLVQKHVIAGVSAGAVKE